MMSSICRHNSTLHINLLLNFPLKIGGIGKKGAKQGKWGGGDRGKWKGKVEKMFG